MSTKSSQMKPATSDLKEELLKWICQRHATNGPLDRQLLREKALDLATSFGLTGFKCSEAWLTLFLKKHGFSPTLTNCNGPTFPDYRVWVDLLRSLITQYRHKDLFNVDQLVMYSDFVPERIFSKKDSHQHGDQVTKSLSSSSETKRIGILMCSNSSGTEKLGTLISGPYHPGDSRNDCHYHQDQSCSSIADGVFAEWLLRLNRDMAKTDRRILLLLNRDRIGASQKASQLSHIDLLYFPKDFPAHLRPLRGDVFHSVKMSYRSRYVRHLRSSDANKPWGIDDVLESVVQAWDAVSQELIVANFQRTRLRVDDSFLKIECPAWEDLGTGISFKSFVTFDDHLSDNPSHLHDDPELMATSNAHQYNLRNSGKVTVDLDDSDNLFDGRRRNKRSNGQTVGVAIQETFDQEFQSDQDPRSSSGLRRKKRNVKGQGTNVEKPINSNDSQTAREGSIAQDFYDDDVTPVKNNAGESSRRACDSFNDFPKPSHEFSEKTNVTVSQVDCEGKFQGRDTKTEGRLRPESMKEVNSNFKRDECGSQSLEQEALVLNFPGEAGPSSEGVYARAQSSAHKNPPHPVREFDDEEETHDSRRLRLNILDAIERCDETETFDDDGKPGQSNDDNFGALKRFGGHVGGDEPAEKRPRVEDSWSKCYETNFVFGPELHASPTNQSVESLDDHQDTRNHEPITKSKEAQTRGSELEKRCIFTLDGSSSGVTFPATED